MIKFLKGKRVKIISDIEPTRIGWMTSPMKSLVGTIQIVKDSYTSFSVYAGGYHWHSKDIEPVDDKEISIPEPQLFDIELLDI